MICYICFEKDSTLFQTVLKSITTRIVSCIFVLLLEVDYFLIQCILIIVCPPSTPPNSSPPPIPWWPTFFILLLEKNRLLGDNNEIKYNKIRQKNITLKWDKATKQKKKNHRRTHSHTLETHKHSKLQTIINIQRTWWRHVHSRARKEDLVGSKAYNAGRYS